MDRERVFMATVGTRAVSELLAELSADSQAPRYQQIYEKVRALITTGRLACGDRLPSIRSLAQSLGVSHITVERSYQQLVAEGYVNNVLRTGHVVNPIATSYFEQGDSCDFAADAASIVDIRRRQPFVTDSLKARGARYDFSFTSFFKGSFPWQVWRQLVDDVLVERGAQMESYAADAGPSLLARQLAPYLEVARGVRCNPEQVIVRAGTRDALQTVILLLGDALTKVAHENPGYCGLIDLARCHRLPLVPLPVMQGWDVYLDALRRSDAKLVFCTPSHQFPTGEVMPVSVRIELLAWAHETGAYIVEDDACHEYRFHVPTIPSLHSLDRHQRVIYMGGFSKSLSPALRVSYLVLPWKLLERFWDRSTFVPSPVSALTQEVLGRFMAQGHWERHVRRMVTALQKRHDVLVKELEETFGSAQRLSGVNAGMHLYALVNNGMGRDTLLASAFEQGAKVYDPSAYWHGCPTPQNHVIIGFSAIDPQDIPAGVRALGRAWLG